MRGNEEGLTKRQQLPASTTTRARTLRREATHAERALWRGLREAFPTAKFRRQVPLGRYFADVCSHTARLVVEVDGDTHAGAEAYDAARTAFLEGEGYRVIRVTNADVLNNLEGVLTTMANALPSPLVGEGGLAQRGRMRGSVTTR